MLDFISVSHGALEHVCLWRAIPGLLSGFGGLTSFRGRAQKLKELILVRNAVRKLWRETPEV